MLDGFLSHGCAVHMYAEVWPDPLTGLDGDWTSMIS